MLKRRPARPSFVRLKLGLSQQQLADTLGVSRSMVAMVETGKRKFPEPVADIYYELSCSAAALNPEGFIAIKRGRKPACQKNKTVTNSENGCYQTDNGRFYLHRQRRKEYLQFQQQGLRLRKIAWARRSAQLNEKLQYISGMLGVSAYILQQVTDDRTREAHTIKASSYYTQQLRLQKQLKKFDPVAILQLEWRLRMLEVQMEVMEERMVRVAA